MDSFKMIASDNRVIEVHQWVPNQGIQALVLAIHPISKDGNFFSSWAKQLSSKGWALFAPDLRGHGKSLSLREGLGHFHRNHGWDRILEDLHYLLDLLSSEYREIPIFLLGHGIGALMAQDLILREPGVATQVFLIDPILLCRRRIRRFNRFLLKTDNKSKQENGRALLWEKWKSYLPELFLLDLSAADSMENLGLPQALLMDILWGSSQVYHKKSLGKVPLNLTILLHWFNEAHKTPWKDSLLKKYRRAGLNVCTHNEWMDDSLGKAFWMDYSSLLRKD